ncbi:M48 family metalloprotease [Pleomorphomonas oryzae]|uniref:M48 family metalloprotease n=1 Tax=Pleomorphomonas oryzae TaxID=261934 RepID=UPI000421D878|nr:M48 family metalloprotease [Pleomorphomonas oryzae]
MSATLPELDTRRLAHGGVGQKIALILSAWLGVFLGSILLGLTGFGTLAVVTFFFPALLFVPVFGFVFGSIGVSRSRDRVISHTRTKILPADHPLTKGVAALATKLDIPCPSVGVYPDQAMNAFAAGSSPQKAVVSFSQSLVDRLPARSILAIAAHELAHVANRDMRRMQYATSFQNALTWYLFWWERGKVFVRWILGFLGELMLMRLSRTREFWADATGAALIGKDAMMEALRDIHADRAQPSPEYLAYARMMIRANPKTLLSTHPTLEQRLQALRDETYIRRLPYRR